MPLIKPPTPKPERVNLQVRVEKSFLELVEPHAEFIGASREYVVTESAPEAPRQIGEAREHLRAASSTFKSQSEHDWAYAKRALARGDDPEQIIQQIAEYRADEKDDPGYYARLTVGKAQAEVEKTKSKSMTAGTGEAATTPSSEVEPEH